MDKEFERLQEMVYTNKRTTEMKRMSSMSSFGGPGADDRKRMCSLVV